MICYKITDKNGQCRDFQYKAGETYLATGEISLCNNGFHCCEQPMDCLSYQNLYESRFWEVDDHREGVAIIQDKDKLVTSKITIIRELTLKEYLDACFASISKQCETESISGYSSKLAASGYYSQLAASGNSSKLAASGNSSQLAASGDYSQLAASGNSSQLAASGDSSQLAASGDSSQLAASGDSSKLAASGDNSVCAGVGINNRVKVSAVDSWIVLADWRDGKLYRVVAKKPGQKIDGIVVKTDHWYWFEDGKFSEEKDS